MEVLETVPAVADLARETLRWASSHNLDFRFDQYAQILPVLASEDDRYPLFSVHQDGLVHIPFAWLAGTPAFADKEARSRLADRIGAVVGVRLRSLSGHPTFPAELLSDAGRRAEFFSVFDDLIATVRTGTAGI